MSKTISKSKPSIKKMFTNYHHRLFVLIIVCIFLLFIPIVNCTNDHMKTSSTEKHIRATTINNHLYNILKQKILSNDYTQEEIKHLIEEFIKKYPYRRASSFHAMRGKRSINID